MAAPCCCQDARSHKASVSCLGRCDLPKHKCLDREDVRPGPVPKHMGWLYTARDAPYHQLRCGWRPGHISCPVLRRIEQHNVSKCTPCSPCYPFDKINPFKDACSPLPARCYPASVCPPSTSGTCRPTPCRPSPCRPSPCNLGLPLIRIIRHNGQYSIMTKPSNITNHPSGPYPLKYVLNTDEFQSDDPKAKFSVEAKYNDYHFDYTSSQSSFILDFTPPDARCSAPCPRRSSVCFPCQWETDSEDSHHHHGKKHHGKKHHNGNHKHGKK